MAVAVENVRKFLREKEAVREKRNAELFKQASRDVSKMIDHIIRNYSSIKIYQWGSLLRKEDFDELSDIDIAIEGLESSEDFFKLYGELDRMTDFSLDLIELDRTDSVSRKSILERGRLIYG